LFVRFVGFVLAFVECVLPLLLPPARHVFGLLEYVSGDVLALLEGVARNVLDLLEQGLVLTHGGLLGRGITPSLAAIQSPWGQRPTLLVEMGGPLGLLPLADPREGFRIRAVRPPPRHPL